MSADAFCLECKRPLVYCDETGWRHIDVLDDWHQAQPDRGVPKP